MARGNGYTNPQRVTDRSFNALIEGGKALTNRIATSANQITQNVKLQKEQAQKEQDELDIEMQSMFSKVNELPSTTNSALDNNIHSFWNGQVDEYFKVKNDMDNGTITRQEGNRQLAQINGLVGQFKTQAKYLGEQCALYSDAINNQQVSSTGSVVNKNFLQALCKGGDVRTVMKDGQLVYQLGEEGQFLNGTELIANAGADKNLFNKKTDFSELTTQLFNKTAQPDSPDSQYLTTEVFKYGDPIPGQPGKTFQNLEKGMEYTMQYITQEKKDQYLRDVYNSPGMNVMIQDNEAMLSEWQDNIPDGYANGAATGEENSIAGIAGQLGIDDNYLADLNMTMDDLVNSSWHEYPTDFTDDQKTKLDDIQNKIAKTYLARKSYDDNGLQLGAIKTKDKRKISPPISNSNSSSSGDGKPPQFVNQFNIKYNPTQIKNFEDTLEKEDVFKSTIKAISNRPSQEEILNYVRTSFPKLIDNPGDEPENQRLDPSYGTIDDKMKLINAINDAYGFKSGSYTQMKKQANKYKSQTGGGGGASRFNTP
tara:strand:+ start:4847 stop:6460 length:1614 start_codon:yes stop_codon:yes gene_type:complete